jgi:FkbM family methyltransferase
MNWRHLIRRQLRRLGYDLHRFNPERSPLARRKRLLQHYGIAAVLDVGANVGQFARELRDDVGYTGEIVSFEPLAAAFASLQAARRGDPSWRALHCALGAEPGTWTIHVAANSESSSLLEMLPAHRAAAPYSGTVGEERVEVRTLDGVLDGLFPDSFAGEIYLKIDTQGYEREVLRGAKRSLARIRTLQLELSLVPLYRDAPLFDEMCALLGRDGYRLVSLESGFTDARTGEMLQADGIFHRD